MYLKILLQSNGEDNYNSDIFHAEGLSEANLALVWIRV